MTYLVHVTLNTGHVLRRDRASTDESSIAAARSMLDWALPHGGTAPVTTRPGYRINATAQGPNLLVTVWGEAIGGQQVPILTTGVALKSQSAPALWSLLTEHPTMRLMPLERPQAPWAADRIEIGAALYPEAMAWTGALSPALAWAWHEIRA